MRYLQLSDHLTNAEIQTKLSESTDKETRSRWQIIYLIQVAKINTATLLAPVVNLSVHSIYKIVEKYNTGGKDAIICRSRGGRKRALLSPAEEAALFVSLEQKAAEGLIKTANDIRSIVEERVGKVVSEDYLWDLFHRNGWKKKMPRPHHPKRSLEQQAEFKKNFPKNWSPPQ